MKALAWVVGICIVLAVLFYAFNKNNYKQQENSPMQNTTVQVVPISHASLVLKWGDKTIYADPIGDASQYAAQPKPDIILVTHEHSDHYNADTIAALMTASTTLIVNQRVADMLPSGMKKHLIVMKNGDTQKIADLTITAIPAYNLRADAQQFHPQGGRDNGYVLEGGETRVYIAGDTEDTPEMRALQNIDIAFLPMNLPYTMSIEQAASATLAFKPAQVYPYHYRGPDGLSDVNKFKELVAAGDPSIDVELANWYSAE